MLDSLHRRPRGRAWAEALALLTNGRVPGPPSPARPGEPLPDDRIVGALMANRAPAYREAALAPTRELLARLDPGDGDAVVAALDAETRAIWDAAPPWTRERLKLIFGVHHRIQPVLEKTGLETATPPDDVHAMGRGPVARRRRFLDGRPAGRRDPRRGCGARRRRPRVGLRVLVRAAPARSARVAATRPLDGMRPERGRDRLGRREPRGDRVLRQSVGPAAHARRRLAGRRHGGGPVVAPRGGGR